MCGIAGIAGRPDAEALARMLGATRHRGPDDQGTWGDETVSLGMNRLSILDLTPAGHQPMLSPDGRLVLVYNGELYNFREERRRLEALGHVFRSQSDTEVVLALYARHGAGCLEHMRGMFAFAVWDRERRELFAARDHLGIKPFVYSEQNGRFIFCSELKGMMAHGGIPKTLDRLSLTEYFITGHINQPRTIFSRIRSLLPGHYLTWRSGRPVEIHRYWKVSGSNGGPRPDYREVLARTRDLILQSVAEELVSDVPLGVFLSGGIDSSVVVAAMRAAGAPNIQSYSIGFAGEDDAFDESTDARASAAFFGTDHRAVDITSRDVEADFENMVRGFDQPVAFDAYNTYLVSKHARTGVTVALSGIGGDELFGGYYVYRDLLRDELHRPLAARLARATQPVWQRLPLRERLLVRLYEDAARATLPGHYSVTQRPFTPALVQRLLDLGDAELRTDAIYRDLIAVNEGLHDPDLQDPFQRLSLLSLRSFMGHRLLRDADAVSMIHSLEVRVPLIDRRVVEYVFPLPWDMKFDPAVIKDREATGRGYDATGLKRILVDAFAQDLPPGIGMRSKRGFSMPVRTWLRNAFASRIDATFGDRARKYFRPEPLSWIHGSWRKNGANAPRVWAILVITEWLRQTGITSLHDTERSEWDPYETPAR
ncbi:MAG: asparagine synthase (glutamine-hydrolyzing) [Gemmatimonadales bacterium]